MLGDICSAGASPGKGGTDLATSKKPNTVEIVTAIAQPVVEEMGLKLWDVRFEKEGASWYLRVFIDKEGGVDINDCEQVSRRLDKLIDEADPISQSYYFEVSSPGIGRDLVRPWHFEAYLGQEVEARTIRPIDGVRDFRGKLLSHTEDSVTLEGEAGPITLLLKDTSYVRLYEEL